MGLLVVAFVALTILTPASLALGINGPNAGGAAKLPATTLSQTTPRPVAPASEMSHVASGDGVIRSVEVGGRPSALLYDPANGMIYVANAGNGSDQVSVISSSTESVVGNLTVGSTPDGLALDSTQGTLYVANGNSFNVSIISTATGKALGSTPAGYDPDAVAFDSVDDSIFVVDGRDYPIDSPFNVTIISGASQEPVGSVHVGEYPGAIAYDPVQDTIYVANLLSDNVSIISGASNHVIRSVKVGHLPDGILYDPSNGVIYVANEGSENLTLISGASERAIGSAAAGPAPGGLALNSDSKVVYVTSGHPSGLNFYVSVVSVANGSRLGTIDVGAWPSSIAYDSAKRLTYVANSATANVSIIGQIYTVDFKESGLPTRGGDWSVSLKDKWVNETGAPGNLTATSIFFTVPNGSFDYLIRGPASFRLSGTSAVGAVELSGVNVSRSITFVRGNTFRVHVREIGLENLTTWCVVIGSTICSDSPELNFTNMTPSGYTFTVVSIDNLTPLLKHAGRWSPGSSGSIALVHDVALKVRFGAAVYFNETGLAPAILWKVTSEGMTASSTGASIVLYLTNGTFSFYVHRMSGYVAQPRLGMVTVYGLPQQESISFAPRS
jgi:YVTN family beta-propeller protein